jgi:hypothetical protein
VIIEAGAHVVESPVHAVEKVGVPGAVLTTTVPLTESVTRTAATAAGGGPRVSVDAEATEVEESPHDADVLGGVLCDVSTVFLANICDRTEPVSSSADISKLVSWRVSRITSQCGRYEAWECQQRLVKLRSTKGVGERFREARK